MDFGEMKYTCKHGLYDFISRLELAIATTKLKPDLNPENHTDVFMLFFKLAPLSSSSFGSLCLFRDICF